eukprot:13252419-Ditylum_brightwellii.AAC.1
MLDIERIREKLKQRIPQGVRIIADSGYLGESEFISTESGLDPKDVAYFKACVLSCHESFNAHL